MKIEVYIYIGRKPEGFYKKAIEEYQKRLTRYVSISYKYLKKEKEWMNLCKNTDKGYYLVEGKSISSEKFGRFLGNAEISGQKRLIFYISEKEWYDHNKDWINNNISDCFSISKFTMSAPLQALILYEQIYRGYRILHHHPYHK